MAVLEDQPNACWPVELADTTAYDKGEANGCQSRRQQALVTARSGLKAFFFTVFPLWSAAVETE